MIKIIESGSLNKKTVLITGINGFIGTHLARYIKNEFPEARVIGIDLYTKTDEHKTYIVDLLNKDSVFKIVREIKPDFIFHLAGIIYSNNWKELYLSNVEATVNLLEAVRENGLSVRVIVPGSAAEYGLVSSERLPLTEDNRTNPVKPYGVSKVWQTAVTQYYASLGVDVVIGRVFNVIGEGLPENSSIGSFARQISMIKQMMCPARIMVGNLSSKRDFLDIYDVCSALVSVALRGKKGEIYNISSGSSIAMEKILVLMCTESALDVEIVVDPSRMAQGDIPDIFGSNTKLVEECAWHLKVPIDLSIKKLFA